MFLTLCAFAERISHKPRLATTNGAVVEHSTSSIVATGTWAGVRTLSIDASFVRLAIRVDNAFGSTARRYSNATYLTGTYRSSVYYSTNTVRSTR